MQAEPPEIDETSNQAEPPEQDNKKQRQAIRFDNSDLIKSGFWVGQIFLVIATVAGVYLAAQEGLSQALLFENLNSKEKNFYLQHALADELGDNVITLDGYAKLLKDKSPYDIKAYHPMIDSFVWDNMKFSPNALETPSQILSAIRRYNSETALIIKKIENRQFGAKYGADLLVALNQKTKDGALEELINNYTKLHHELTEAGIDVNPL
ncbi:hypothetical protein [uncultured Psychromonas sp.]|uniref:hypothetical protein n=1 Tax=uncultured Psychromonas sp. TaxID=173974 RepID=UPI00261DECC9|nr:hypothetical protein [uncultured Psychromonas sp.]